MADYRDMAAALGGGYGQDTGGITPDTLITLKNGKTTTASDLLGMIKGYGQAVGSNLESLGRGGLSTFLGGPVDTANTIRTPYPMEVFGDVNYTPDKQLPGGSRDILGMMPRATAPRPETAGMEELGGYMTPATAKVLKPAATSVARMAGQEINAGLTGQPTRSLLGTITPQPKLLDVYHGTPHTLPPTERNPLGEFDASKIGTGEGAQAYGYGIYTAEAPAVAKEYQKQLGTQMKYKGQEFYDPIVGRKTGTTGNTEIDDYLLSYLGDTNVIRKELLNAAKEMRSSKNPQAAKEYQKLMSEFRKVRPDVTAANTGNLYKIDLPDEKIATMLDWDKPLSEQPKNVQEALAKYDPDMYSPSGNDYSPEERGQWIYMRLAGNTTQKNASNKLKEMGIPGIKYFDELSRRPGVASMTQAQIDARISSLKKDIGSGLGNQERMKQQLASLEQERASHPKLTRNFVVFPGEEKNMTILERNAEKITK